MQQIHLRLQPLVRLHLRISTHVCRDMELDTVVEDVQLMKHENAVSLRPSSRSTATTAGRYEPVRGS